MSVYVEGILPYPFTDIQDTAKAVAEIKSIQQKLMDYFHVSKGFDLEIYNSDEDPEWDCDNKCRIINNISEIDIELGNGFLYLDCGYNHSRYFCVADGKTWLRDSYYDIVKALGFSEIYIVDEYHGSNHCYKDDKEFGEYDFTFDDWKNEFTEISVLAESLFHKWEDKVWPEIDGIYLERFEGCNAESKRLNALLPGIKFLTTSPVCGNYYLVLDNEVLKLFDAENKKFLRCGKFDGIECRFNAAGFLLFRDNRSAFYNLYGKRLTPFRVNQKISWEWDRLSFRTINIYDRIDKRLIFKLE